MEVGGFFFKGNLFFSDFGGSQNPLKRGVLVDGLVRLVAFCLGEEKNPLDGMIGSL